LDRKKALLVTLLIASLLVVVVVAERGKEGAGGPGFPTTYSASARGLKAFYLLLEKEGYPVERLEEEWVRLKGEGDLLVLAGPFERELERREGIHLRSWIKRGNTLLWFTGFGDDLPHLNYLEPRLQQMLGLEIRARDDRAAIPQNLLRKRDKGLIDRPSSLGYSRDVSAVAVGNSRGYDVHDVEILPIYGWMEGHAVYRKEVGEGYVFLFPSSQLVDNTMIDEGDNVILVLNVIRNHLEGGTLFFDEYHHGFSNLSAGHLFKGRAVKYAFLQLGLVLFLYLFSRMKRFGETVDPGEERHRKFEEFITAMGRLYRQGKKGVYVLDRDFRFFRKRMANSPGFSLSLTDEEFIAKLEGMTASGKGSWKEWYEEFRKLDEGMVLSDKTTLRLSKELAKLENEVFQ
jgi:hypothetical protein